MPDTANNNVISLDKYDSSNRKSENAPTIKVLEEIRELCRQRLTRNMRCMMTKCDDTLYGCAQMAESTMVHDMYLDAIHDIRTISADIEKKFIDHFIQQFNLGVPRHIRQWSESGFSTEQNYPDTADFKREQASEDLAVYKMIEKTRAECADTLRSLDIRIGFLISDPDLELWQNPFSPEPICEAFRTAVTESVSRLEYGFEIRPVLFNLFNEHVLGDMNEAYKELNFHLTRIGVQPRPQVNTQIPGNNAGMPGLQEPGARFAPEQVTIQAESRFSDNVTGNGEQQASNNARLQPHSTEETLPNQSAGKPGGVAIDAVVAMFESVLEHKSIAGSMRALLGRLQIPLIKVAIEDHHFFSDNSHPARLLLNRLTDSAIGWEEHLGHDDPLYRKIEAIVQTILVEFDQDISLFGILMEDLEGFLENMEVQAGINVQSSIKILEGEERLEDARSKAMEQVEGHIHGECHLDFVNDFIATRWKDLLSLTYARQGKDSDEWKQALSTMYDLLWSVKPKNSTGEHQRLMALQSKLLSSLREGMHRLSVPVTEQDDFLAKLMHAHASTSAEPEHKEGKTETASVVVVEDEPDCLRQGSLKTPKNSSRGDNTGVDDDYITQARQLQPGAWIELLGSDGKIKRAKLSWVSPITKTCLFTDQKGLNAGNYSVEDLAQLLRAARARSQV